MRLNPKGIGLKTLIIRRKDPEWNQLFDILVKARKKWFADHLLKDFVYELEEKTEEHNLFNRGKYSYKEKEEVFLLRNKGMPFCEIARKFNISNRKARLIYASAKSCFKFKNRR